MTFKLDIMCSALLDPCARRVSLRQPFVRIRQMPRRRGKIREALAIPLVAGSICSAAPPSSPADSLRWISAGDVALALFAYVTTPVWIGLALASVSSPGFVLERTPQGWHSGYSFGTGIGWSGDSALWTFSRLRLQAEYEHIRTGAATLTALLDWNALPVLLPEGFRLGGSLGAGIRWRRAPPQPYVHGELWLRNAMGMPYLGFFPQHSLGVRLRLLPARPGLPRSLQLGLAYTATFVW
jgi:hypothetical protein